MYVYIYTHTQNSAIKMKEPIICDKMNEPRMNMLSEISLTEKDKFCVKTSNVKLIEL